jgi:hypothetical protein
MAARSLVSYRNRSTQKPRASHRVGVIVPPLPDGLFWLLHDLRAFARETPGRVRAGGGEWLDFVAWKLNRAVKPWGWRASEVIERHALLYDLYHFVVK